MKRILLNNIQFLYKKSRKKQINIAIDLNTFELLNFGKACKNIGNIMWIKIYYYPDDIQCETVVDDKMTDEIIQIITEYLGMVLRIYKYKYYKESESEYESEEGLEELDEYQENVRKSFGYDEPIIEEQPEVKEEVVEEEDIEEESIEEDIEEESIEEDIEEESIEEEDIEEESIEEEDIPTNVLLHQGSSLTIKPNVSVNAKITAIGPAWTYDTTVEKPAGEETNGTSTHLVYTEEQQKRLNIDKYGSPIKTKSVMRTRSNSI
jgi:hypothetical protein